MEWIVKIDGEKDQRIRITFHPLKEEILVHGEYRFKNQWEVFDVANKVFVPSNEKYSITLDDLQSLMERVVLGMRGRIREHENLDKGFTVLKEVAFVEDTEN